MERELNMTYLRGPAEGEESAGGGEDGLDILPVMGAPLFAVTIPTHSCIPTFLALMMLEMSLPGTRTVGTVTAMHER